MHQFIDSSRPKSDASWVSWTLAATTWQRASAPVMAMCVIARSPSMMDRATIRRLSSPAPAPEPGQNLPNIAHSARACCWSRASADSAKSLADRRTGAQRTGRELAEALDIAGPLSKTWPIPMRAIRIRFPSSTVPEGPRSWAPTPGRQRLALDFEAAATHTVTVRVTDSGAASFDKTSAITLTNANDAPAAVADTVATAANTPVTVPVLANDTDPDRDTLTVTTAGRGQRQPRPQRRQHR